MFRKRNGVCRQGSIRLERPRAWVGIQLSLGTDSLAGAAVVDASKVVWLLPSMPTTAADLGDHLRFWAKSAPLEDGEVGYHPVSYHLLDVAAVAEALLEAQPNRARSLERLLKLDRASLLRTIPFLVGLHDLGKFSACFQTKVEALWPEAQLGPRRGFLDIPHGAITQHYLCGDHEGPVAVLVQDAVMPGWMQSAVHDVVSAIGGHHGRPLKDEAGDFCSRAIGGAAPYAAAATKELMSILDPAPLPDIEERGEKAFSWILAGLCVLCDWVGSNRTDFPAHAPTLPPAEYFLQVARPAARRAVLSAGLSEAGVADHGAAELFPRIAASFSPVQRWAAECEIAEGPSLTIVEDATGSGKTEAALILALRLMRETGRSGVYFALPTMATANAMYARLETAYRRLFDADSRPSLSLAHGRRDLHPGFSRIGLGDEGDPDRSASGDCSAWIADDRRKAFLAQVGAGTVDQALLAVLPSRHQSLRLLGLADKILIVDEAHAYDAYMSRELEGLLEFQAALGGSAVVLSATLPTGIRKRLADAFRAGLGAKKKWSPVDQAFPLATVVSATSVAEHALDLRSGLERSVTVDFAADVAAGLREALSAAAAGAAVLVIRNTVDEAIATADELGTAGAVPVHLFHARFAMSDRQRIEADVLARWGREGRADLPRRGILVATQIVEQSLDLDFDLAVTDLAPIDMLIQRAGRVWRHLAQRPAEGRPVAGPRLVVIGPRAKENDRADWLAGTLPKTPFVYRHPGILWRTARALQAVGRIDVRSSEGRSADPSHGRRLVENIYEEVQPPTPAGIEAASGRAEGKSQCDRSVASHALLKVGDAYTDRGAWRNEVDVTTRLDINSRTIRLGRRLGNAIVPWSDDAEAGTRLLWSLSEVSVATTKLDTGTPGFEDERMQWGRYERDMPLVVLDCLEDGTFTGTAMKGGNPIEIIYDPTRGLRFS